MASNSIQMKRLVSQSFSGESLASFLRRSDFSESSPITGLSSKDRLVYLNELSQKMHKNINLKIHLRVHGGGGKKVFIIDDFDSSIILRKVSFDLKRVKRIIQSSRKDIVDTLLGFLKEGLRYRIYRYDIKDFFESTNADEIVKNLKKDKYISPAFLPIVSNVLSQVRALEPSVRGVPRGLSLSSVLAELSLGAFDDFLKYSPLVSYYARFVDDIVIITDGTEDKEKFEAEVIDFLSPFKLNKSSSKYKVLDVQDYPRHELKGPSSVIGDFQYLGYKFLIYNYNSDKKGDRRRKVDLQIATKKVSRLKRRIKYSIIDFYKNSDESLLRDRLRVLTHKYYFREARTGKKMIGGMSSNYSRISKDCASLHDLNKFIYRELDELSNKFVISDDLKKINFTNGFRSKVVFNYTSSRLNKILECWAHD